MFLRQAIEIYKVLDRVVACFLFNKNVTRMSDRIIDKVNALQNAVYIPDIFFEICRGISADAEERQMNMLNIL